MSKVKDAFSTATSNDVHVYSEQAYKTNCFTKSMVRDWNLKQKEVNLE